jgi:glycosyltransferase involved in cell wall biosynthesis
VIATSCQGPSDPAFRVRLELPGHGLVAHGVRLELLPLFSADQARRFRSAGAAGKLRVLAAARRRLLGELREIGAAAPSVLVQRHVDLTPSLALERAAAASRRLIYDVDDAIWLAGRPSGGHPLGALKGAARKVRWLAERAEHVIAGNEILAERLSRHSNAVTVVPSLVDPASCALRRHEQGEVLTLGWVGSPTTAPYLHDIAPVLERYGRRSTRPVRLLVVGGSAPRLDAVRVEERTWSPAAEREALAETDIGLMPLRDTPWTRGKCAYKALQYMACGIPAVVDDVGISAATVGGAGCVAAGAAQWLDALDALAEDAGLRARLGELGRRRIEEEFSPGRWLPILAAILRGDPLPTPSSDDRRVAPQPDPGPRP